MVILNVVKNIVAKNPTFKNSETKILNVAKYFMPGKPGIQKHTNSRF